MNELDPLNPSAQYAVLEGWNSPIPLAPEIRGAGSLHAAPAEPLRCRKHGEDVVHREAVSILEVAVSNLTEHAAIDLLSRLVRQPTTLARAIYFVNAHTLNHACADPEYRRLLNAGYRVFGDGTGVRWAARCQGVRMQANLNGTDLVPAFFRATAGQGHRYFLLGADESSIARAADAASKQFSGWKLAGFHHGYIHGSQHRLADEAIEAINASRADLLLVGMGNPLQERWIDEHLPRLRVRVCMGVGGLFDHWAGNLRRAPRWIRAWGCEWLQLLLQQPHKARRYLIGNPLFLYRVARQLQADRLRTTRWRQAQG